LKRQHWAAPSASQIPAAAEPVAGASAEPSRELWRAGAFCALAFALAWLAVLPLLLGGRGLADSNALVCLLLMMSSPALSALLLGALFTRERGWLRRAGLRLGPPGWWKYWLFGWLAVPLYCYAALALAGALGFYPLDLLELTGFRQAMEASPRNAAALQGRSIHAFALEKVAIGVLLSPILNALPVLGEELGWRGYLLPRLEALGQWRALVLSGLCWGLWHMPVILLGYNYPLHPQLGVLLMAVSCTLLGIVLGWTRLATGSLWPAVIGHAALNGSGPAVALFHTAGASFDTANAGPLSWTGWILLGLWIAALVALRRLPLRRPLWEGQRRGAPVS
jgi:membrane protease YdiL (CAAX protease family)